jgi:hypothetical protein
MADERSKICPGCHGKVSPPRGSRKFTLEQIMERHKYNCPARGVEHRKEIE